MASIDDFESVQALVSEDWSDWTDPITITQEAVNTFADITRDHQWIHVDIERSNAGPFGGTIVHGFFTLSLVSYFSSQAGARVDGLAGVLNYGGDRLRFLAPVPVGSDLHARMRVVEVTQKSTGVLLKQEVAVHVVGNDTPALVYESLSLLLG